MTTTEAELLLCCARTHPVSSAIGRASALLSGPVRWDRLLNLAGRHRVLPLLHQTLGVLEWVYVPQDVRSKLRLSQQANAARCLRLTGQLVRLLSQLDAAGIPAIPFKGVTLASRAFGDVAFRDAGDLDLLVSRADVVRAVMLLEGVGLRRGFPTSTPREADYLRNLSEARREAYLLSHCEHHLVDADGDLNVDLHWAVALREFSLPLDTRGLWERATTQPFAGRDLPALSDEDLLLVLCVNGAKDCWERLDRVCDVAELIRAAPQLDWNRVFDLARHSGAQRILRLGLSLAWQLLDASLPQHVQAFARDDRHVARLTARGCSRMFDGPHPQPGQRPTRALFDLTLRERWRDRVRYCAAQLRPGVGDWAGIRLPRGLEFLYYLVRPFRLAGRYLLTGQATLPADRSSVF